MPTSKVPRPPSYHPVPRTTRDNRWYGPVKVFVEYSHNPIINDG